MNDEGAFSRKTTSTQYSYGRTRVGMEQQKQSVCCVSIQYVNSFGESDNIVTPLQLLQSQTITHTVHSSHRHTVTQSLFWLHVTTCKKPNIFIYIYIFRESWVSRRKKRNRRKVKNQVRRNSRKVARTSSIPCFKVLRYAFQTIVRNFK